MKKLPYWGLILALALLLCACTGGAAEPTQAVTVAPTETTAPAHSQLYLPQYTAGQIQEYFEEVVLRMEYTDGTGDVTLVQKWNEPILYRTYGQPTGEDLAVLEAFFTQLNGVEGFPGIRSAREEETVNLTIEFLNPAEFNAAYSHVVGGEDSYGAVQFWYYTETNEIYTASIGYRTDIDQTSRNSVLIEEIVNMLGITDTVLRPDSIVYQYSNDNLALSDVDWVILKLLYHPAIHCGMDLESCNAVIRQLYY